MRIPFLSLIFVGATALSCAALSATSEQCTVDSDCEPILGVAQGAALCELGQCSRRGTPQPSTADAGVTVEACTTTAKCTTDLGSPAVCLKPGIDPCVKLTSTECPEVSANYNKGSNPVFLGIAMPTTTFKDGAEADNAYAVTSMNGARMALEQWDVETGGGIVVGATRRPLVGIFCNTRGDANTIDAIYTHLSVRVDAKAIIAMNTADASQLVARTTNDERLLYVTDGGQDSVTGGVATRGLVWFQSPSALLEIPARIKWLEMTEARIRQQRALDASTPIKVVQVDITEVGAKQRADALAAAVMFNGKSAADNGTNYVRLSRPNRETSTVFELAQTIVGARPEVVMGLGLGTAWHQQLMPAIEALWPSDVARPYYIMGSEENANAARWPVSIGLNDDLRARFQGAVLAQELSDTRTRSRFNTDYMARYSAPGNNIAGGYDAIYVLGYTVAGALRSPTTVLDRLSGADFAKQFSRLIPGSDNGVRRETWPNIPSLIGTGVGKLAAGGGLDIEGTQSLLDWNPLDGTQLNDATTYCGVRNPSSGLVSPMGTGFVYQTRTKTFAGSVNPACF